MCDDRDSFARIELSSELLAAVDQCSTPAFVSARDVRLVSEPEWDVRLARCSRRTNLAPNGQVGEGPLRRAGSRRRGAVRPEDLDELREIHANFDARLHSEHPSDHRDWLRKRRDRLTTLIRQKQRALQHKQRQRRSD